MTDAARALPESVSALPAGTRLHEFEIKGLLGVGGFGIVYLAFDHALEREVAVKEYMPASMAGRTETLHVSLRSRSDADVFALGLRSFVNEAKLLARFDHPSLIKVHRFWEANGTAYMAMPVLRGRTLKDIRRATGRGPDEAWIRAVLTPLLGALEQLHTEDVYHRDIAPDNIHLEAEGRPVLLDFGAARRVISGKTQTLTAILKPAYAPIEQYGETSAVKQGPWTDLYALGATLHFMLVGYPPAPATARAVTEEGTGLGTQNIAGVSPQMLGIVEWMLSPRPLDRPQNVGELRAVLDGRAPLPQRARPAPAPVDRDLLHAPVAVTVPMGEVPPADLDLEFNAPQRAGSGAQPAHAPHAPIRAPAEPSMAADVTHRMPPPSARSRALPYALAGVLVAAGLGYFGYSRMAPSDGGVETAAASAGSVAAAPGRETSASPTAVPASSATTAAATAAVTALPASASQQEGGGGVFSGTAGTAGTAGAALAATAGTAAATVGAHTAPATSDSASAASSHAGAAPAGAASQRNTPAAAATRPAQGSASRPAPGAAAEQRTGAPAAHNAAPSNAPGMSPASQGAANASPTGPAAAPRAQTTAGAAALPASAAEPGAGASPEARCSGRNPLSYFVCMERECVRARFRSHPECQAWRQQARPRDGG